MILEPPLEPPVDKWEDITKPEFIRSFIFDVAEDITMRGYRTQYHHIYDIIYEHISENMDLYYSSNDHIEDEDDVI